MFSILSRRCVNGPSIVARLTQSPTMTEPVVKVNGSGDQAWNRFGALVRKKKFYPPVWTSASHPLIGYAGVARALDTVQLSDAERACGPVQ